MNKQWREAMELLKNTKKGVEKILLCLTEMIYIWMFIVVFSGVKRSNTFQ